MNRLNKLDRDQLLIIAGKRMTVNELLIMYNMEKQTDENCLFFVNELVRRGKIRLVEQDEELQISGNNQNTISFDDCLKKHFPMQASTLGMINDMTNSSLSLKRNLYDITLDILEDYKGNYELEDIYLGALIMHVRLGNISGFNLEELFDKLNWIYDFKYDVLYRLAINPDKKINVSHKSPSPKAKKINEKASDNTKNTYDKTLDTTAIDLNINEYGNTSGNINNGGIFAYKGDYIYCSVSIDGSEGIFRERFSDGKRYKIYNVAANCLNVVGDWVYFNKYGSFINGIAKIKTDGTSFTTLSNDRALYMHVNGDWIYYTNSIKRGFFSSTSDTYLYKMKTDGTNKTRMMQVGASWLAVCDEWIYFFKKGLCRMKSDGTGFHNIIKDYISCVNISNNSIYFIRDFGDIYKCDLDGNNQVLLYAQNGTIYRMNVANEWIYYIKEDDGLYKMRTDGTMNKKIVSAIDNNSGFYIVGNKLYYSKEEKYYSITI